MKGYGLRKRVLTISSSNIESVVAESPDRVHFWPTDGTDVIVWFAGINEPFMSDNLAKSTGCNVLTVRDLRNLWYSSGILEQHSSVDDAVSWLNDILAPFKNKIFIGQSSGGYAALHYGNRCNADLIIAFSPQTRNMRTGQNAKIPQNDIVDLRKVYFSDTPSCPIIINIGQSEADHEDSFFWNDWLQIDFLRKMPYVTLAVHPYHNHSVSGILKQKNILYKLIKGFVDAYAHRN
jgi:pimeloyl-ACP methyl ester carboxylesterase